MSILDARKPKAPLVREIMTKKVYAVGPNQSVYATAKTITDHKISSVPVVDQDNSILGFVTAKDCLSCLANCLFHDRIREKTAADIMTKDVETIKASADLFELEDFFVHHNIHHAPVVDKEGALVGMISRHDALLGLENLYTDSLHYKEELKTPVEFTLHERMKYLIKENNF